MSTPIPPFDPARPNWHNSMNRVVIADLPGLPAELRGIRSYNLLCAEALTALIKARRDDLHIAPDIPDAELPIRLNACFQHANQRVAAEEIAAEYGRRLGWMLATLKRGDPVNRAVRDDWNETYWAYWATIERVILGGGLISGELGAAMIPHTLATLATLGVTDLHVERSTWASLLPMVGAARHASPGVKRAYILDFGGTSIKRGTAEYEDGNLLRVTPLDSVPALHADPAPLFEFMVGVMANAAVEYDGVILACLATYMENGHPQDGPPGYYGALRDISAHLQTDFARVVSERTGRSIRVGLFHDGTAAATPYAGMQRCAVLTLGTALGVGFPPLSEDGLRPLRYVVVPGS